MFFNCFVEDFNCACTLVVVWCMYSVLRAPGLYCLAYLVLEFRSPSSKNNPGFPMPATNILVLKPSGTCDVSICVRGTMNPYREYKFVPVSAYLKPLQREKRITCISSANFPAGSVASVCPCIGDVDALQLKCRHCVHLIFVYTFESPCVHVPPRKAVLENLISP